MRPVTLRCLHLVEEDDCSSMTTYPWEVRTREDLLKAMAEHEIVEAIRLADGMSWTVGAPRERIIPPPCGLDSGRPCTCASDGYQGEGVIYDLGWRKDSLGAEKVPPEGTYPECQSCHDAGMVACPVCGYDPPPF